MVRVVRCRHVLVFSCLLFRENKIKTFQQRQLDSVLNPTSGPNVPRACSCRSRPTQSAVIRTTANTYIHTYCLNWSCSPR